jgi:hypothetical protein
VTEKYPTKTKPAIAKNALDVSFLALRVPMQVGEILQNKNNLAPNLQLIYVSARFEFTGNH